MKWWLVWDSCFIMCSVSWNFFTSEKWQENSVKTSGFQGRICDLEQTGAGCGCSELASVHQLSMWSWSILDVRKSKNWFSEGHFVTSTGQCVWWCLNKGQCLWNILSPSLINFQGGNGVQHYHIGMSRSYFGKVLSAFLNTWVFIFCDKEIRNFAAGKVGGLFLYKSRFYF